MNRIAELKKTRAGFLKSAKEMADKDDFTADDKASYDACMAKVEALNDRIARLESISGMEDADTSKDMEDDGSDEMDAVDDEDETLGWKSQARARKSLKSTLKTGTSFNPVRSGVVFRSKDPNYKKGMNFGMFLLGSALCKNSRAYGTAYVREELGNREVAKALSSSVQSQGGALIPQEFLYELQELKYSETVVRGSGVREVDISMGNLTIPTIQTGSQAVWLSENVTPNAVSTPTFANIDMSAKKLGAFTPISNDLIRRSPFTALDIVMKDQVRQLSLAEDSAFLFNNSATTQPYGLTYFAPSGQQRTYTFPTSNAITSVNNMLNTMMLDIEEANFRDLNNAVWASHPAFFRYLNTLTDSVGNYFFEPEISKGELLDSKIMKSNLFPTNVVANATTTMNVFYFHKDALLIGNTYRATTQSWDGGSYDTATGSVNGISTDQTVIRTIEEMALAATYPKAISVATVINGAPSLYTGNAAGFAYSVPGGSLVPSQAPSAGGAGNGS